MFSLSRISSFTMNSIWARHGSKLSCAVLGAAIIGLSPLPANAGTPIATTDQEIVAALEMAAIARAAYTSYSTAATNGCLSIANNAEICVISTPEQQVAVTEPRTVVTPSGR